MESHGIAIENAKAAESGLDLAASTSDTTHE
jgi:hypothetical protein